MPSEEGSLLEIRTGRTIFFRTQTIGIEKPKFQFLFLHGTCASSSQFDQLINKFNFKYSVVCHLYDAISCGRSPFNNDWEAYHTDEAVLDLKEIVDNKLDASIPLVIVGHSYAPSVIIRYFSIYGISQKVTGCIFLSTAIFSHLNLVHNGGHPIFKLPVFLLDCLQPMLTRSFIEMAYHPETDKEIIQQSRSSSDNNSMYMAKAYHTHHEWVTKEECAVLHDLPSLVIHGKDDKILPLEAGEQMADTIRANEFCKINKSSHQVMEEKATEVSLLISKFIENLK